MVFTVTEKRIDSMTASEKVPDRRSDIRQGLSLQINLLGHKGVTINISANGVYFEVITNDIKAFSPGTTIPIQIEVSAITTGFKASAFNLNGSGSVIRNDIKDATVHGNRLGVAMKFNEKLDLNLGLSQGLL